jgi:hypothetical protein
MYMYQLPNDTIRCLDSIHSYVGWKLIAKGELVEGDGMDDE